LVAALADLVLVEEVAGLVHGAARGVLQVLEDDVLRVVDHALEIGRLHVEDDADAGRGLLEEPDVRDGHGEFDVAHALAADLGLGHLDAAAVADDALELDPAVLAARAFEVARGPEDALAEQAVALGLERAVVDRLRLLDLAVGPGRDLLRGGDREADRVEIEEVEGVGLPLLLAAERELLVLGRDES